MYFRYITPNAIKYLLDGLEGFFYPSDDNLLRPIHLFFDRKLFLS